MKWILENFQVVIAIVAALAYYLTRGNRTDSESQHETPAPTTDAEREQAERTRRIQEEIRRKISERRGTDKEVITTERAPEPPPLVPPSRLPPVDPFGGPMRRFVRELERAAERRQESEPELEAKARAAELERQSRLSEQLRALQQAREAEERRAAEIAAKTAAAKLHRAREQATAIPRLHGRLRNPHELRRAVVLREILGPPVGLR